MFNTSEYQVRLPAFEGPLDLLLHLIEQEQLDITTIALAQLTDQYLDYVSRLEERRIGDLAGFLVVAAKLLLIKSQALLPRPPTLSPEDEQVGDDLVQQLRIYKRFKEVAALLHEREELELRSFARIAARPRLEPHLDLGRVTLDDLVAVARETLTELPALPVGQVVPPVLVTVHEQIDLIQRRLAAEGRVLFRDLLTGAVTRVEIIVTLLALLELVKRDRAHVQQDRLFGPIVIQREAVGGQVAADVSARAPKS